MVRNAGVYLDWNASAPLRPEARQAVCDALDITGNPSSVHSQGRAARGIVERARAQVSDALGAAGADVIFTSGASEASALALAGRDLSSADVEHDAVMAWTKGDLAVDGQGKIAISDASRACVQLANAETGVVQSLPSGVAVVDATQAFGKVPVAFDWLGCDMAFVSAHKLGGPRGVGALIVKQGLELAAQIRGGGQEMNRRSGTENVAGIAGFGAAATAATDELASGVWDKVAGLRNRFEAKILDGARQAMVIAQNANRLPNTSYFSSPGWKGETQVMAMDLAGYAVSAGSACSSGKVRTNRVLKAMGLDESICSSAIRVSIGPETLERDLMDFADTWIAASQKYHARAA